MTDRYVTDEPVRGGYPSAEYFERPGLERIRAMAGGQVPRPPSFRLFGIRPTHASQGTAIITMPASPWFRMSGPSVSILPLISTANAYACGTFAPPSTGNATRQLFVNYVRQPTVSMQSFIAKARVVTAGAARATAETHVEDSLGRTVAVVIGQSVFGPRVATGSGRAAHDTSEPRYATPDPPDRAPDDPPYSTSYGSDAFREVLARALGGDPSPTPLMRLTGLRIADVGDGAATITCPASEWLSNETGTVMPVVSLALSTAMSWSVATVIPAGNIPVLNSQEFVYVAPQPLPPDGREMLARARVVHFDSGMVVSDAEFFDQDGRRAAMSRSVAALVPERTSDETVPADRFLATVVFADVVGSTPVVQEMGDARWKQVLEDVQQLVRKQLAVFRGHEVKATGDGVLATFDSPARAIQCARAIRDGVSQRSLQTRIGVHLGEIERLGDDVAGIAVHVASRVESEAEPGTIVVTSTVRDAVAGSGIRFSALGTRRLKGIDDEWTLFAVAD